MRIITIALMLASTPMLSAQPAKSELPTKIAPFIDEHTMAVVRVDVSRVPVELVLKFMSTVGDAFETEELAPTIRAWAKDFVRKGGRDLFFTYGPLDFPNPPVLCAPIGDSPAERKDLGELLKVPFGRDTTVIEHVHGCVCVGTKDALAVVKARKAAERAELMESLHTGSSALAQFAFTLSKDARRIHEQIAPLLPDDFGGGDIRTLTRGFKWLAITVDVGDKLPVKIIVQATDNEAANKLHQLQTKMADAAPKFVGNNDPDHTASIRRKWEMLTKSATTTTEGTRVTTRVELGTIIDGLNAMPETKMAAERSRSTNNLKQLMIALHNYHDTFGQFPTDVRSKDGKALLSWRVRILPFIEYDHLYKQFKLDEPWDSEHNKKLIPMMPKVLRSPRQAITLKEHTTYLAPLGKDFMWDDPKGIKLQEVTDGTSNTITLVEADDDQAVIWTKPADLTIDAKDPFKGLLGHYGNGFLVTMGDGSVQFFPKSMPAADLKGFFTRNGGEVAKYPK